MSEKNDYIIEMHGIQKSFGGVKALRNIDLQVKRGSCHALLGENGAGKSTLMKVLTGIIAKDSGKILLNGEEVQIQSLRHAEELGIAIVPQELSFISYFTVAENIFYGEEPTRPLPLLIDWKKLYTACDEKLKELKIDLPSKMQAGKLNVSDQQMMVIARVLAKNANIIIMDMILLGGLLVFALVGFWMMGRVDRFLNAARAEQEGRQHAECLKIAASDPCVMQPVFKTVSALKEQHPDLWCELSFGREAEVLGCLSTGNVDVAILPGETGGGAAFESRDFLFSPVSFRAVEDCTTLSSIDTSVRRQRILLKQNTSASLAAEFVQRICEQKP